MKLVGIAIKSYNRMLLEYISNNVADMEILNVKGLPKYSKANDLAESETIQYLNNKINSADGVIIAAPGLNDTLENAIQWAVQSLTDKPVMVIGDKDKGIAEKLTGGKAKASVFSEGNALLEKGKSSFNKKNELKDQETVSELNSEFNQFAEIIKASNSDMVNSEAEDLSASHPTANTVKNVDMADEHWVEKAAKKTKAVSGKTYVQLDRGLLTVDQLNSFLNSMPYELTYADDNNQFIYYNNMADASHMLAPRQPKQVGDPLTLVHPKRAVPHVKQVIHALRTGKTPEIKMPVPGNNENKYIMHYYRAMHDPKGKYAGVNEYVMDIMPFIKYYLKQTGQKLVKDEYAKPDAISGASEKPAVDATSSASVKPEDNKTDKSVDAGSGASEKE